MRALSVKQPWAGWIMDGSKTIETRTWETKYRGPLLICSGKQPDRWAMPLEFGKKPDPGPLGVALGVVELVACRPMTHADEAAARCRLPNGVYLYAWVLQDPRPIAQFHVTGQLGLFDVELPAAVTL